MRPLLSWAWRAWGGPSSTEGYAYFPVSDPDHLGFLDRISATLVLTFTIATGASPVFP